MEWVELEILPTSGNFFEHEIIQLRIRRIFLTNWITIHYRFEIIVQDHLQSKWFFINVKL